MCSLMLHMLYSGNKSFGGWSPVCRSPSYLRKKSRGVEVAKDPGICLGMFDPNAYGFGPKIGPMSDPNCVRNRKN